MIAGLFDTEGALVVVAVSVAIVGAVLLPKVATLGRKGSAERHALRPTVDALTRLALFDGAPRWALERVAAAVMVEAVALGTALIVEGAQPDDLFIAREGSFEVSRDGQLLNTLHAGDWFGEIGLVRGVPRTATVTAITPATVWRIPGDDFLSNLEAAGAPSDALVEGIADRLARMEESSGS